MGFVVVSAWTGEHWALNKWIWSVFSFSFSFSWAQLETRPYFHFVRKIQHSVECVMKDRHIAHRVHWDINTHSLLQSRYSILVEETRNLSFLLRRCVAVRFRFSHCTFIRTMNSVSKRARVKKCLFLFGEFFPINERTVRTEMMMIVKMNFKIFSPLLACNGSE